MSTDTDIDPLFNEDDLGLIESLVYDPELNPTYDALKSVLIWADEWPPRGVTPEGFDNLSMLWVARACVHHGRDFSSLPGYTDYLQAFWQRALAQNLKWPGMSPERLTLTEAQQNLLANKMREAAQSELL